MIEIIQGSLTAISTAIGAIKQVKTMLPDSPDKAALEQQLSQLDHQLKLADTQVAQTLEYKLCKCTFPPQIMLYNKEEDADICPSCGHKKERPRMKVRII